MSRTTIATVVEGRGEVAAVPVLLRRMAAEFAPESFLKLLRPHKVGRGSLLAPYGLEREVEKVAVLGGPGAGVLVLLDADDDCPATLVPSCWPGPAPPGQTGPVRSWSPTGSSRPGSWRRHRRWPGGAGWPPT